MIDGTRQRELQLVELGNDDEEDAVLDFHRRSGSKNTQNNESSILFICRFVWDLMWASDDAGVFVTMEKSRMFVFKWGR